MNKNKKITYQIYTVGMFIYSSLAYTMHMPTLSDILIRPLFQNNHFQLCTCVQGGIHDKAYSEHGAVNALRIWQPQQNALAMLNNFDPFSAIGMKRIQIDAIDDGTRGYFIPSGDVSQRWVTTVAANVRFYQDWTLRLYMPFYATELSDVCWSDQTLFDNEQDLRVRQYLTNDFFNQVKILGNGLDLGSWKRVGIGDMSLFFEWDHHFIQTKPFLKSVHLNVRSALHIPTGKSEDVDKIAAFAFGHDGAWGVSCALGLDLSLSKYLQAGLDVQLTHIFGNTKMRRIKTDVNQTDLLLLQKAMVYKDSGLEQQFSMYVEAHSCYNVTARIGYQFFKHGEDTYALVGNAFSNTIINTAERLQDFTMHHIVTTVTYKYDRYEHVVPSVKLFAFIPVKGKRSIASTAIGGILSFDF
jgi:hypothetical protein